MNDWNTCDLSVRMKLLLVMVVVMVGVRLTNLMGHCTIVGTFCNDIVLIRL